MSAALRRSDPPPPRHFLDLRDHNSSTLRHILDLARAYKTGARVDRPLVGKTVALVFEKPSTRTRVSFEVAMRQLGGDAIVLSANDMQLGRGETIGDTASVLSRYVDAIMLRTSDPAKLAEMVAHATVPVVNGLTSSSHPCQLLADVMTIEEHRGPIAGQTVAWVGDGNNVARTFVEAAARFGFSLRLGTPKSLRPDAALAWARGVGADVSWTSDPAEAVRGAVAVVTDTWISMSDADAANRHNLLVPYRVDAALMDEAGPDALFMHCLPAHRGEEVTAEVIDGPRSVVFDEAENRLHAQKGVLVWALAGL